MATFITIASIFIVLALIVWFFVGKNPGQSDGDNAEPHVTDSERFYSGVDRPAGPDAEAMDPDVMLGSDPRRGKLNTASTEHGKH